ncbi:hypothetical protein AWZ03_011026 [Drosophila navojoa]|uniref:NADH dehydrogenase [ubiquinone] 1 alpha subcomplex subunit 7 n=1 Tax=Drosophila navojoa TaxID=7232 RepID=A0A484B1A6_DRONA|nr:NADH dehydrogenase [ubiquinone] 1 alpha subcomplex subunit 7 [Drosophila navojoa]TDG42556.1 hypothetical protein AWZ03_011026 [Drosophila navojoa]
MAPNHREISPFLKLVRDFLLGRKHVTNNRYAETVSARSQTPPTIPEGPPTRLFGNQYYLRDPRRQMGPPIDVVEQKKKELAAAKAAEAAAKAAPKDAKPGAAAGTVSKGGPSPPSAPSKAASKCAPAAAEAAKPSQGVQHKSGSGLPVPGKMHNWD